MPRTKTCSYCGEECHHSQDGVTSITLYGVRQFTDNPSGPWFCSMLCCNMAKYEMGYIDNIDHKVFMEMKQKLYPHVVFRQ